MIISIGVEDNVMHTMSWMGIVLAVLLPLGLMLRVLLDPCLICVLPISKTCANSFFDRSYVYAAPTLWNAP